MISSIEVNWEKISTFLFSCFRVSKRLVKWLNLAEVVELFEFFDFGFDQFGVTADLSEFESASRNMICAF